MEAMISQRALRDAARHAGFVDVSASQLKRLRRAGLLQPPTQHHTIGCAGSETLYPPEALPQLLGILRIRQTRRLRPFEAVAFLAWEEGLWVEHTRMRHVLAEWVRRSVGDTQRLGQGEDAEDEASRRTMKLDAHPSSHPLAQLVQSRLPEGRSMQDVALVILQLAEGLPDAHYSAPLLDAVTGFDSLSSELGYQGTIIDAFAAANLPRASKWPRVISRASQKQLAAGLRYLRAIAEFADRLGIERRPPDDTDKGIEQRAHLAAMGVLLGPAKVDEYATAIQATPT